jgi:hypothetical protein
MKFTALAVLTALALAGCGGVGRAGAPPETTAISMEQYECFWHTCPHYRVVLQNDGSAVYTGMAVVRKPGTVALRPGAEAFRAVAGELDRIGFFNLRPTYRSRSDGCSYIRSDQSSVKFSATRGGKTKTVFLYYGCEGSKAAEDLAQLVAVVDRKAGLAPLLGKGSPSD